MILKTALIPFVGKSGFASHTKHRAEAIITDLLSVATPGIYFRVFLKKYKLHNLIKREIHILTIITIKKHANT